MQKQNLRILSMDKIIFQQKWQNSFILELLSSLNKQIKTKTSSAF